MSYDLHVYSRSGDQVSIEALQGGLAAHGWRIAFAEEWMKPAKSQGALTDGLIIGWDADSDDAAQIREAATSGNESALDAYHTTHRIAACEVCVTSPMEVDDFEDRFTGASGEQTAHLRDARTHYYLRTGAGRGPLSTSFQEAVWYAIGDITAGVMEDPQSGQLTYANDMPPPPGPGIVLPTESVAPKWTIGWYLLFALVGVVLMALASSSFHAKPWYVAVGIAHAPLAYGLYRGFKPARWAAVALTSVLLLIGLRGMFMTDFSLRKLIVATIYARILMELFSPAVKAYFDDDR